MTDNNPGDFVEPQAKPSIRWRLVPATFFYGLGGLSILASILMSFGAVYVNLRFGRIAPGSDNPARNAVVLSVANLTIWQLYFWIGVTSIFSATAWRKGHWRMAWISTGIAWLLMGLIRPLAF